MKALTIFILLTSSHISSLYTLGQSAKYWYHRALQTEGEQEKLQFISKALDLDPGYIDAYDKRVRLFFEAKKYEAALFDLDQLIKLEPKEGDNYYYKGVVNYELGNYERALEDLELARKNSIRFSKSARKDFTWSILSQLSIYTFGNSLISDILWAQKPREYQQVLVGAPSYQSGTKFYDHAPRILLTYNDLSMHYYKGITLLKLGRYKQAIKEFDKGLKINYDQAIFHLKKGIAYDYLGNYRASSMNFSRAVRLQPSEATYTNRGIARFKLKQWKDALEDLNKALELDPKNWIARSYRSSLNSQNDELESALKDVEFLIHQDPQMPVWFYNRALILEKMGQKENALEDYEYALQLSPSFTPAEERISKLKQEKK